VTVSLPHYTTLRSVAKPNAESRFPEKQG